MTKLIQTAVIAYRYKQTKTGKFAAKTCTCAKADLALHLSRLEKDANARKVRVVA